MQTKSSPSPLRQIGFTLIEMIVFITIVSIALAGTLSVFTYTAKVSADPVQPKQAMLVAESMLEEIELKPYNNPSGGYAASCPATCNRALFDNVADYAGYTSNGVYSLDDLTTPVPGLTNYTVSVAVTPVTVSATGNAVAGQRITVTVTVGNVAYTLSGYRFDND